MVERVAQSRFSQPCPAVAPRDEALHDLNPNLRTAPRSCAPFAPEFDAAPRDDTLFYSARALLCSGA